MGVEEGKGVADMVIQAVSEAQMGEHNGQPLVRTDARLLRELRTTHGADQRC